MCGAVERQSIDFRMQVLRARRISASMPIILANRARASSCAIAASSRRTRLVGESVVKSPVRRRAASELQSIEGPEGPL